MTPERYRQIGELYHAALELDGEDRAAFLERACADDEGLRHEVESLVSSHEQAADFIVAPAMAVAAELFADGEADALSGRTVSHYKILSLIGAGGMGRVYLAEDTQLGRRVALKFLPEYFTNDKNQVQRFRQEARAASALNHPNILTVYEVGQVDGTEFIATEYVEGETLRDRLAHVRISVREALDVAVQVADALVAAHQAGIVHRDVKPENVMLRADGYVKVLDFGLAKLTENLSSLRPNGVDALTIPDVRTNPGVVMGTPDYMSPEQARGFPVDARTDVWSLGVVLYEVIAGRRPFGGATRTDVIVSILEREPAPLARHPMEAAELERIVTKALTKNVEERYQTVKDMAIDLRRFRRRMEVDAEIERSVPPEAGRDAATARGTEALASSERERGATPTGYVGAAAPTSSLEFAVTEIRRHKAGAGLAVVLFIAALVGGGYGLYWLLTRNEAKRAAPFEAMKITRLTSEGTARMAAISPDGRYVAYVLRSAGRETLRVRQVATSSDLQVVRPAEAVCIGLTFSPDGDYVYYVTTQEGNASIIRSESENSGTLYQVPVLGGALRRLVNDVDGAVTFSPDGKRFAFVRADPDRGETALMIANADGSGEQRLAARPPPDVFLIKGRFGSGPAWSPDGKVIACGVGRFARQQVVAVSAVDGSEKSLGSKSWQFVGQLSWFPDGSGLVMMAMDQRLSTQLWRLSYPVGEISRITNDLNIYDGVSLNADASSLVTVQMEAPTQHLWVTAPGEETGRAKKIISTRLTGEGPSWTPDGRIVYTAMANDSFNLWVANPDGTEQKQLTTFTNPINVRPSVSPDGRHIVFVSDLAGPRNIWRVDIDGSNPVRLTGGELDTWPTCSPDGLWVVYTSNLSGKSYLWKVSIDGGAPVQLTRAGVPDAPSISPDGKFVAYVDRDERAGSPAKILVIPFDGGDPVGTFDLPATANLEIPVRWTPDGRALTYAGTRDGVSNVLSQPLEGGAPRRITDFKSDQIRMFDWSRDGKQLALWRGTTTRNVVLISDFR
ncbi:MAG: LpqB family beta-propeller domain-containing protein [Pyrinomonadaceae bacterium]